jgi:hypothetical protein
LQVRFDIERQEPFVRLLTQRGNIGPHAGAPILYVPWPEKVVCRYFTVERRGPTTMGAAKVC